MMPETWELGVYKEIECLRIKITVCEMRNTLDREKKKSQRWMERDGWEDKVVGRGK